MLSLDIFKEIDKLIPKELAIKDDKIGYFGFNYKNTEISKIKIMLDILPKDDEKSKENELIITKHPPTFTPKTPTYVINTNWDIIDGGSSDVLAKTLNLDIESKLDKNTGMGRLCSFYKTLDYLLSNIKDTFNNENIKVTNPIDYQRTINKIALIPGNGFTKEYIKISKNQNADVLISGDLIHNSAILAKKFNITLIDISNYNTQMSGLYALAELLSQIGIPIEIIDKGKLF